MKSLLKVLALPTGMGLLLALTLLIPAKATALPGSDWLEQFYTDEAMTNLVGFYYLGCGGGHSSHGDTSSGPNGQRYIRTTSSACDPEPDTETNCYYTFASANSGTGGYDLEGYECPSNIQ